MCTIIFGGDGDSNYDFVENREEGTLYELYKESNYIFEFYVPEDYDGLVLSNTFDGYTEEWYNAPDIDGEGLGIYALGPDTNGWTYTADQLFFIRVNDYIK